MKHQTATFQKQQAQMEHKQKIVQWSGKTVTKVPFKLDRRLIVVQALINDAHGNFIFDTGAPGVVLNQVYFNQDEGFTIYNIDFYGNKIQQQVLSTMNLKGIEQPLSSKIHGLIGKELFANYDVLFDYNTETLTLITPEHLPEFEQNQLHRKRESVIPIKLRDHIPLFSIYIEGKQLTLGIDSGAEINLIDDSYFKLFRSRMNLRKLKVNKLIGVDKQPKTGKKVPISTLEIGGITFTHQDTMFLNLDHLEQADKPKIDGLIGFEVLSQQPTLLSYSRGEMIFYKREHGLNQARGALSLHD